MTRVCLRHVAVAHLGARSVFCGHVHRRPDLAERCRVRMMRRLPGVVTSVATSWRESSDPCPMRDHHDDRACPVCGSSR